MKKYYYTLPFLLGFLLSSCELTKVVKPKLKDESPKVVIDAKFKTLQKIDGSVSNQLEVYLSRSQALSSYEDTKITGAQISVQIDQDTPLFANETEKGHYVLDLAQSPQDNASMQLQVDVAGKVFTANSYFPVRLADFNLRVITRKPDFSTETFNILSAGFVYPAIGSYYWFQAQFEPVNPEKLKYKRAEKLSEYLLYPNGPDDNFGAAVGNPINPIFFARTVNRTDEQKEKTGVVDIAMDENDKAIVTIWAIAKDVYVYYTQQLQVQGSFNSTLPYNPDNNFKNKEVLGNFSVLNGLEKEIIYVP